MSKSHSKAVIMATLAAWAILAMGSDDAQGQQIREKRPKTKVAADDPLKVFMGIERAWSSHDADGIARYVGEARVYLDVWGIGQRGNQFSRSQVLFLFKRMFEVDQQTKFEFVKFHNLDEPDRKVFGIAFRSVKNNRNGRVHQDKVYVTLGREGPGWVVAEIKTTQ